MSATTESVLDTTSNKKWSLIAVTKTTCSQSALTFKVTNGTISNHPIVKRLNRKTWMVVYDSQERIPKYVHLFVARYFAHWFSPMQLP
jgi:DNA/RNA endonuclease G (NUC1)